MIRRAALHRCAAWLALAAVALVVMMPVVFRFLPAGAGMPSMGGDRAIGMRHGGHPAPARPGDPGDSMAWCGYCTLLNHTPVAGSGLPFFHVPALRPASPLDAVATPNASLARLLTARPHGPPAHVSA